MLRLTTDVIEGAVSPLHFFGQHGGGVEHDAGPLEDAADEAVPDAQRGVAATVRLREDLRVVRRVGHDLRRDEQTNNHR